MTDTVSILGTVLNPKASDLGEVNVKNTVSRKGELAAAIKSCLCAGQVSQPETARLTFAQGATLRQNT